MQLWYLRTSSGTRIPTTRSNGSKPWVCLLSRVLGSEPADSPSFAAGHMYLLEASKFQELSTVLYYEVTYGLDPYIVKCVKELFEAECLLGARKYYMQAINNIKHVPRTEQAAPSSVGYGFLAEETDPYLDRVLRRHGALPRSQQGTHRV